MNALDPALLWFLAGLVLVIAEFAAPGVILIFIGLGAWVTSLLVWLGWLHGTGAQIAVFTASSLVFLFGLRRFCKDWFTGFSESNPGQAGEVDDYTGRSARVIAAISDGAPGKVEYKGANWRASSSDSLAIGDAAVIERIDGLCLVVRRKS